MKISDIKKKENFNYSIDQIQFFSSSKPEKPLNDLNGYKPIQEGYDQLLLTTKSADNYEQSPNYILTEQGDEVEINQQYFDLNENVQNQINKSKEDHNLQNGKRIQNENEEEFSPVNCRVSKRFSNQVQTLQNQISKNSSKTVNQMVVTQDTPLSQKKFIFYPQIGNYQQKISSKKQEDYQQHNSQLNQLQKNQITSKLSFISKNSLHQPSLSKIFPKITQSGDIVDSKDEVRKTVKQIGILIKAKNKLRNLINQRFSVLSAYERMLIGDSTDSNFQDQQKVKKKSLIIKILSYQFHPLSYPIILFKTCMLIVTLYTLLFVPLVIGFDLGIDDGFGLYLQICGIVYLGEVFIKFRTSLYEKGEIIKVSKKIALNYLYSDFIFDLLCILGCALSQISSYILLLNLVRFNSLFKYLDDINNHYYLAERYHKTWTLTKLLGFIFFMAHYFACIFHFIAILHENDESFVTWTNAFQITDLDWQVRYNYSLYFSFITCITIGYGDITPKNSHERLAVMVFSIFSTMCVSFSVNTIGNIFQDYFIKFQKQLLMRYNAINFMSGRNICKDLQLRVLKYIEYIHEIENQSPENGLSIINKLSHDLKSQVFQEYYGQILQKNKQFSLNYSKNSIEKLAITIKEQIYAPGEKLFEQGETDYKLFYLIKGECEFYLQNKRGNKHSKYQTINYFNQNGFFGYKGFISGIPREMSCRSKNVVHVFYIERDDLIQILKEDHQDYEQFCKIRDQFQLYTNSLGEECFGCKKFGHTLTQCPQIHLVRNRELVALRHNYSREQKRQKINRRDNTKQSTIKNLEIQQQITQKFKKDLVIDLYLQEYANDQQLLQFIEDLKKIPEEDFLDKFPHVTFLTHKQMILNEGFEEKSQKESSEVSITAQQSFNDKVDSNSECSTIKEEDENNCSISCSSSSNSLYSDQDENVQNTEIKSHVNTQYQKEKIKQQSSNKIIKKGSQISTKNDQKTKTQQIITQNQIDNQEINISQDIYDQLQFQDQLLVVDLQDKSDDNIYLNQNKIHNNQKEQQNLIQNQDQDHIEAQSQVNPYNDIASSANQNKLNDLFFNRNKNIQQKSQNYLNNNLIGEDIQEDNNNQNITNEFLQKTKISTSNQTKETENKTILGNNQQKKQNEIQQDKMKNATKSPTKVSSDIPSRLLLKRSSLHQGLDQKNQLQSFLQSKQNEDIQQRIDTSNEQLQQFQQQIQKIFNLIQQNNQIQDESKTQIIDEQSNNLKKYSQPQFEQNNFDIIQEIKYGINKKQMKFPTTNQKLSLFPDLYIFDFDCIKEYQKYFPHNNASAVCQHQIQQQDKKNNEDKQQYASQFIKSKEANATYEYDKD